MEEQLLELNSKIDKLTSLVEKLIGEKKEDFYKKTFTTAEAAKFLMKSPRTLKEWRKHNIYLHFHYKGKRIFYTGKDLQDYLNNKGSCV
jgi:hypothetical protein